MARCAPRKTNADSNLNYDIKNQSAKIRPIGACWATFRTNQTRLHLEAAIFPPRSNYHGYRNNL
ncbi:hypothetical protein C1J05_09325 [Sulfitobacter sp. JL08]|nr:hypothetical protein C1J05_09325 [Sulfitobacter sp. JL08]